MTTTARRSSSSLQSLVFIGGIVGLAMAVFAIGHYVQMNSPAYQKGECNYSSSTSTGVEITRIPPRIEGDSDAEVTIGLAISEMKRAGWISSDAHIGNIVRAAQEGSHNTGVIYPGYPLLICVSKDESRITSVGAVTIKG